MPIVSRKMRAILVLAVALLVATFDTLNCEQLQQQQQQQQQVGAKILRRVIKSTPTASNLARVRLVTVRSPGSQAAERGAVSEISSKEAASFGQRSSNDTSGAPAPAASVKSSRPETSSTPNTSTASSSTTSTTIAPSQTPSSTEAPTRTATSTTSGPAASSTTASSAGGLRKASERQLAEPVADSVEVLSSAPSSWQMMSAVEAPAAAALIAAGTRPATDLSSSSSEESSLTTNDFLRSSSSATKGSYVASNSVSDTFSRLRQGKTSERAQKQTFFYPQQQRAAQQVGKTSQYQATKTQWYQPSTTPRPAPLIQQQQQYTEQQSEQYVEQQQQVDSAPPGQAEPFAFDFNTQDNSGNGQYRKEESDSNGVVRGSYGYTDANGIYRHVEYVADHNGFRANIKSNEPGLIGETQPASIRLSGGNGQEAVPQQPPATSQRFSAPSGSSPNNEGSLNDWTAASNHERADLALAPPDFESSHKPERLRTSRSFSS